MNKKKGQAAMEFLMTYGWAILAAIIVIAVLAIYFRPGKIAPSQTTIEAPFSAAGWSMSDEFDTVLLEIKNAGAENLDISEIALSGDCNIVKDRSTWTQAERTVRAGARISEDSDGTIFILDFDCGAAGSPLTEGQTFSADISIKYLRPGSSITYYGTGTVSGAVDP